MRLLCVISRDLYLRNFVDNGAFDALAGHEVVWLAGDEVSRPEALAARGRLAGIVAVEPRRARDYATLMYQSLFADQARSSTFRIKTRTLIAGRDRLTYALLAAPGVRQLVRRVIWRRTSRNERLEQILRDAAPDLVIAPSAVTEPLLIDVARACRRLSIPTLFLINGWDNLSSKMVFAAAPDYLAVWGEQSREDALRIHGIGPERVFPIGMPTFDRYRQAGQAASPYPFRYAVFAGCALPFDELSVLRELDAAVDRLGLDLTVVYRPHPWRHRRKCPDVFEPAQYRHVVLDEQMRSHYASTTAAGDFRTQKQFMPALDYYPGLLRHAQFVISPLSTVMLESAACGTPVLVLAYDDGIHPYSPGTAFHEAHFRGLADVPGFRLCLEQASLSGLFSAMARDAAAPAGASPRPSLEGPVRRYLYTDERAYAERLREVVNRVGAAGASAGSEREALAGASAC